MKRRAFLEQLVGGLALTAAVRTWPFRVYSFPTESELFDGWVDIGHFDHLRIFDMAEHINGVWGVSPLELYKHQINLALKRQEIISAYYKGSK